MLVRFFALYIEVKKPDLDQGKRFLAAMLEQGWVLEETSLVCPGTEMWKFLFMETK